MWHAGDWCACAVGKMAKDIGMTIHKSIVVSFLPCLDPFTFFHFLEFFFAIAFLGGEKTMVGCLHSCSLQVHRR